MSSSAGGRVGLDLDNTIIQYDRLFHTLAVEEGLIDPAVPATKAAVRDHVREVPGGYPRWVELQGRVYGAEIHRAEIAPGVAEFLAECRRRGRPVSIISHKTPRPAMGPPHDLHAAARAFLVQEGFFDPAGHGLDPADLVFLPTREEKLEEIARRGCALFVDDLLEVLSEPEFPGGVERLLIGGEPPTGLPATIRHVPDWAALFAHVFA